MLQHLLIATAHPASNVITVGWYTGVSEPLSATWQAWIIIVLLPSGLVPIAMAFVSCLSMTTQLSVDSATTQHDQLLESCTFALLARLPSMCTCVCHAYIACQ